MSSKKGGLNIDLSGLDIVQDIADFKMEIALKFARIGEEYVTESKTKSQDLSGLKKHKNWTYVLRNAHSYVVYIDGVSQFNVIGSTATLAGFDKVKTGKGVELIVGNGTEYASWVEGKGFDVISSGILLVEREVRNEFDKVSSK